MGVTVPAGFVTDGASVPEALQWTFEPFSDEYATACVVHDYLYYTHLKSRLAADWTFLILMIREGTPPWKAFLFFHAVRLFGSFYY